MDPQARGATLIDTEIVASKDKVADFCRAVSSPTAAQTATLALFFGPTVGSESTLVEGIDLDLSRALLGTLSYTWQRPFVPGERVRVQVTFEDVYDRGDNQFGVVVAEFRDQADQLVQRQSATFIERGGARR